MSTLEGSGVSQIVPRATRSTAFAAGASLIAIVCGLDFLALRGVLPYDGDSPQLRPFVLAYFFVTSLVFVVGLDNLFPRELKTRIPFMHFPTTREGWMLIVHCWGRML